MKSVKNVVVVVFALIIAGFMNVSLMAGDEKEETPTIDSVKVDILLKTAKTLANIIVQRAGGRGEDKANVDVDVDIYNQYTRTENGVKVFYYDFNIMKQYKAGKKKLLKGTIALEKAGALWKARLVELE
jgi:hypothetical protein